ncbi:ribulose bisphosphate carboxylase/oxygenase activase, chloroplastic-like [Acropora millepora]|uniref:ribulose bisphosphate carboxylase/oxygenase activase, chloroplastic-like n=1 Tax=Acropora millepora TaxID=45264 RepID=UPI001CF36F9D|nr:ribulose bisphosphate carboxylase/oxygenase activase, chloroplastic-like [Acropora millepora]
MSTQCLHFIFQGNPGTGKTTFARKVPERKVVEVQRGNLVGQFLGSTQEKTANKINEAKGGVLLIDEAYRLTPRSSNVDYGLIGINQLMAAMEKGDPVMIFAGYPNEMKEFLKSNPGLDSRIKYKFTFPDYSVQELPTILDLTTVSGTVVTGTVAKQAWLKSLKAKQRQRSVANRTVGLRKTLYQKPSST